MALTPEVETKKVILLLSKWIARAVDDKGLNWLQEKQENIAQGSNKRQFFTSFSSVPRYLGKADLDLTQQDLGDANNVCAGWSPHHWSVDQAGRILLVLSLPVAQEDSYLDLVRQLFLNGDVGELIALYQALPLLPFPEKLLNQAMDGIRTNMTAVFNAISLNNPYPATYFDESAWNQVVLKAVFVGSPLYLIWGLDDRANSTLANILWDYAHERWAAKRDVTPELWRLVGKFAQEKMIPDLARVLGEDDETQQEAAALACFDCPLPEAEELLNSRSDLREKIEKGSLNWETVSQKIVSM